MKRRIQGLCCHGSWPYETNTETAEVASTCAWTSRVFREAGGTAAAAPPPSGLATLPSVGAVP